MKLRSSITSGLRLGKLATLGCLTAFLGLVAQTGPSQNKVTDDTVEWYTLASD